MRAVQKTFLAAGCFAALATASPAASDWLQGTPEQQLETLADLQPGLARVMVEYANRFTTLYYAGKGGNWDMAAYQLEEMRDVQEIAEKTRPARAPMLKAFESSYLDRLADAIKARDETRFEAAFNRAVDGCNVCHAANDVAFIKYRLPKTSPSPTSTTP